MKLGFLTQYSDHMAQVAARIGFDGLELHASSWGTPPPSTVAAAKTRCAGARDHLANSGIEVTALAWYGSHIAGKPNVVRKEFAAVMNLGDCLGCRVISTLVGRFPDMKLEEHIPAFKKVFGPVAQMAEDRGYRIAIENWSGFRAYPFHGTNIAYSPQAWDMMFDAVDSPAIGLEFDPSHLHFQMMDYVALARKYGQKIFHVHAKDTEILHDNLALNGIFGNGWWRFRIPGWGGIDWRRFISALHDVDYQGGIAIEHEDPVFSGDRFDEGLQLGYNTLRPLVIP
jgi:sugar phosphate isomerase/epimerase